MDDCVIQELNAIEGNMGMLTRDGRDIGWKVTYKAQAVLFGAMRVGYWGG